jgi:hypothetical protein
LTEVAPVKSHPSISTFWPTGPLMGVMLEIVGGAGVGTVKVAALVPVPAGVVTLIGPVRAPQGTVAVI